MVSFYDTQGDVVKMSILPLFLQQFRVPSLARKSLQPFEHRYEPSPSINYGMNSHIITDSCLYKLWF